MPYSDIFNKLNEHEIPYVVLRKYEHLPEKSPNNDDIDIIFGIENFNEGVNICKSLGFTEKSNFTSNYDFLLEGLKKPHRVPPFIVSKLINSLGNSTTQIRPRHRNVKLVRNKQKLDLRDNLAYKSYSTNKRYPVNESVTYGMINRRREYKNLYVPSHPDELVHLIAHCLFDKNGFFEERYQRKIETLYDKVKDDSSQTEIYFELLDEVFYDAGIFVDERIKNQQYQSLLGELKQYADY